MVEREVEYYTSMDTTDIHPAYLAINGKVLLNGTHKSLKKYKVSGICQKDAFMKETVQVAEESSLIIRNLRRH